MGIFKQDAITIQIVDHLDQATTPQWDSLCQPDHYFTASNLHALAHASLDCSFRYFVAQQADQIVGITFGYLARFSFPGPFRPLLFITGSPVNLGFPFAFHTESQKEEIFVLLIRAMLAEARKQHAALLVVRDLYAGPLDSYSSALNYLGFHHMPFYQRGWIDIRWRTFDEYLSDLRSHYRYKILHDMRRIQNNEYRFAVVPGTEAKPYLADMARLFRYLFLKGKGNPSQLLLPESYFRAMTALPGCVAFLLFRGDQLAAFDLVYERGSLLDVNDSGVDAALVGNHPAHRYTLYEALRYGISRGFKAIDFGTSNETNKMRFGCSLQNLHGFVYPLAPFYSVALKLRLDRLLLDDLRFKVASTNTDDDARGWIRPTVFKSSKSSKS